MSGEPLPTEATEAAKDRKRREAEEKAAPLKGRATPSSRVLAWSKEPQWWVHSNQLDVDLQLAKIRLHRWWRHTDKAH